MTIVDSLSGYEPLGQKVYGFELDRDFEDEYLDAVKEIGDRYFHGGTHFTTSAFMRAKLGDALERERSRAARL